MTSGAKDMFENFKHGVEKKGEGNCLGRRMMSSDTDTPYLWESYSKVYDRVICFGSGLLSYGVLKGAMVGVFCKTCPEWIVTEMACYGYGYVDIPRLPYPFFDSPP